MFSRRLSSLVIACLLAVASCSASHAKAVAQPRPRPDPPAGKADPGKVEPGKAEPDKPQLTRSSTALSPDIHLIHGRTTSAIVTTTKDTENVSLLQSTLASSDGTQLPLESIELCASGRCGPQIVLTGARPHAVTLRVRDDFTTPGSYRGSVALFAHTQNVMQMSQFTLYSTSWEWRGAGACAIVVGIAVSLLTTVFLRQGAARSAALLPAASLADALRELDPSIAEVTKATGNQLPGVTLRRGELLSQLTKKFLDGKGYLPPRFSSPLSPAPDVSHAYQNHLAEIGAKVGALRVLVTKGMVPLSREMAQHPVDAPAAVKKLDEAAGSLNTEADAMNAVTAAFGGQRRASDTAVSELDVRLQLQNTSLAWWVLWSIITAVAGYAAVVATNPGFGGELDLLKCFFWGLGVQGAGQQLQQITPSSVANALKVSVVR